MERKRRRSERRARRGTIRRSRYGRGGNRARRLHTTGRRRRPRTTGTKVPCRDSQVAAAGRLEGGLRRRTASQPSCTTTAAGLRRVMMSDDAHAHHTWRTAHEERHNATMRIARCSTARWVSPLDVFEFESVLCGMRSSCAWSCAYARWAHWTQHQRGTFTCET